MPMVCKCCSHPERKAIDRAIIDCVPNTRIASRYGLSEASVRQHKANHLAKSLIKAAEARPIARAETLLERFEALIVRAGSVAESALQANKHAAAVSGLRTIADIMRTIAELTGQIGGSGTTVNIAVLNQQPEQRLMLDRLSVDELRELRRLVAKAEGTSAEVIEVEAVNSDHETITAPETHTAR